MASSSRYSRFLMCVYRWLWIGRVSSDRPAFPGGALILAAHYNGLVDGFVYGSQLPPARAVISVQWHKHLVGRLLLPGIAVQRAKDAGKSGDNLHAFRQMGAALAAGDRLLFFPEGTSRLGTERLPIARGTLLLLRTLRRSRPTPPVFFCAAHYHSPTRWRSHVSVGWVGPDALPASSADDEHWVKSGLLEAQARAYTRAAPHGLGLTALAGVLSAPYLPLWAVVNRLARLTADDDNVISLWKFLIGVPATLLALAVFTAVAVWQGWPVWLPLVSLASGASLWNQ